MYDMLRLELQQKIIQVNNIVVIKPFLVAVFL